MSAVTGKFVNLSEAALTLMLQQWQQCLVAISTAHQSYSMAGRSYTRANLAEVSDMVAELSYALSLKNGSLVRTVYVDMSGR